MKKNLFKLVFFLLLAFLANPAFADVGLNARTSTGLAGDNVIYGQDSTGVGSLLKLNWTGQAGDEFVVDRTGTLQAGIIPWARITGAPSFTNADTVDGYHATAYNSFTGNAIVTRHSSGYIFSNYFNMSANVVASNPQYLVGEWSGDNYLRYVAPSTVSVGYASGAGNSDTVDGHHFNWSGQSGQPSWLWGGNDSANMYVYNPSNFSVNYANSAGNADTTDGQHLGTSNEVSFRGLTPYGVGGNSGMSGERAYQFGYQESGSWKNPYPDLILGYHTGVKIGGYYGYSGTRFYNDHPSRAGATEIFSVGNGDNNVRVANNLLISGNVGVGTTNPVSKLHVSSAPGNTANSFFSTSDFVSGTTGSDLSISFKSATGDTTSVLTSGTSGGKYFGPMEFDANYYLFMVGNVGIGTAAPVQKLEVNGNIQVDGFIGRNTHSNGYFVGSYSNVGSNDTKTNPIYTIGSNYMPTDTSLSNMYGIGFSHSNFWGGGKSTGWGLYQASGGTIYNTISNGGIWTNGNFSATDIYARSWLRNNTNNTGLYNENNGNHWYSDGTYWKAGNANSSAGGIQLRYGHEGALKGYVYWDGSGFGLLNNLGNWGLKILPNVQDVVIDGRLGVGMNPTYELDVAGIMRANSVVSNYRMFAYGGLNVTGTVNVSDPAQFNGGIYGNNLYISKSGASGYAITGQGGGEVVGVYGNGFGGVYGSGVTYGVAGYSENGNAFYGSTGGSGYAGYFLNYKSTDDTVALYGEHIGGSNWGVGIEGVGGYIGIRATGYSGGYTALRANSNGAVYAAVIDGNAVVYGNTSVYGSLSKSSGSFLIDYPLDPKNKNLQHSFVESPEMRNVYYGQAETSGGKVSISMAEWFTALNGSDKSEYNYQFTPMGKWCQLYVKEELDNNKFMVATADGQDCKFSWTVSAVRHDAYAEKNRIPVVTEKSADKKGACLNKEACE